MTAKAGKVFKLSWLSAFFLWSVLFLSGGCSSDGGNCTDGQELTCACEDGTLGIKVCQGGVFGPCGQCEGRAEGSKCAVSGDEVRCRCQNGRFGKQICQPDGTWGKCFACEDSAGKCQETTKQRCNCDNGTVGVQTCIGGQWSKCECDQCLEGEKRDCLCQGDKVGTQVCKNGMWGACTDCKDPKEKCEKVGSSQRCICPNGAASRRYCGKDGFWGKCDCGGPVCKIGEKQDAPCTCPNGMTGVRYCVKGDGGGPEWGPCDCSCKAGQQLSCTCPNGQKGFRRCKCSGSKCQWGYCICSACNSDAECAKKSPSRPYCDPVLKLCTECLEDKHCKNNKKKPYCSKVSAVCVQCVKDEQCSGGQICHPKDGVCAKMGRGNLKGLIRRCKEGKPRPAGCSGNTKVGDDKGPIYILFFSGDRFPPRYTERPFFVHKIDNVDFSDSDKEIPYFIKGVPAGKWLVYVILDDNNNWSINNHLPDRGDLVGINYGVEVRANTTVSIDFYLFDRY